MQRLHLPFDLVAIGAILLTGCDDVAEHNRRREILKELVARRATRADVVRELRPEHALYVRGEPSWAALDDYLARRSLSSEQRLHEAVAKYPTLVYYAPGWQIPWILLDENDQVQGSFFDSQ